MKLPSFLSDKLGQDILWSLTSMVVMGAAGILFHLLIANLRGRDALGIFTQVYAIYMISSQIAVGGIHLSVLKSVSHNLKNQPKIAEIYTSGLITATIMAAIFCTIGLLMRQSIGVFLKSEGVATGLLYALPGIFFFSENKVLLFTLNGLRKIKALASFNIARFTMILLGIVVLILIGAPTPMLPLALTLAEGLLFFFLIAYMNVRVVRLVINKNTIPNMKQHLQFGLKGFLTGFFTTVNTRVDVIMLGYFVEDSVVGIYGLAATVADGIYLISFYIRNNVDPIMGHAFASGKLDEIRNLARKVRKFFYPLMAGVGLLVALVYPYVIKIFIKEPGFEISWEPLVILLIGIVISSGYKPFAGIFLQGGKPVTATVVMIVLVGFNALLNILLIPRFGLNGAALSTACAYLLEMMLIILVSRKMFKISL